MADQKFFCIRGHMKSGTNWVCRLLNLHPDIHSSGEYHWHHYYETYSRNNEILVNLDTTEEEDPVIRRELNEFVRNAMAKRGNSKAKFLGDRTPHTIHPVVIPRAPHISIIRDCRDVLVSKMFHYFNAPRISKFFEKNQAMKNLRAQFKQDPWFFQKNPDQLLCHENFVRVTCRNWTHYLRSDRHTAAKQPALPVMFVQYEQLHSNVDSWRTRMYEFIGADPALAAPIPANLRPGHSSENPDKFNRKGQVGDWKNYMTPEVKSWINEEAGREMIQQGYIQDLNWNVPSISANLQSA